MILLLGFEPFDGHDINPSARIVDALTQHHPLPGTCGAILPVDEHGVRSQLPALLEATQPHAILALGLGGGPAIRIERIAVNLADFRIPDAKGHQPTDAPIEPHGPDAYFSTLPCRELFTQLNQSHIPTTLSDTAGTYLCNFLLYQLLHYASSHPSRPTAGFVHLPMLPEMAAKAALATPPKPIPPSMHFSTMLRAVQLIVRQLQQPTSALPTTQRDHK
jgi:pyroglutamyl-peptidase